MARGLSQLQQAILLMALKNHRKGMKQLAEQEALEKAGKRLSSVYSHSYDLVYSDIYVSVYGWRPRVPMRGGLIRTFVNYGSRNFSRKQIDAGKYRSAMAAVSKAISRLEERGLVSRVTSGYFSGRTLLLTEKGKETAEKLLANRGRMSTILANKRRAAPDGRERQS